MEEWKEYFTVENITLLIAVATLIVTFLTYLHTLRSEKRRIRQELKYKQAQLKEINDRFLTMGVDHIVADKLRVDRRLLEIEIEQLKSQL